MPQKPPEIVPQFRCKIVKKSSNTIMEMACFEQLSNRKLLKLCVLRLWFKDSGGTTIYLRTQDFDINTRRNARRRYFRVFFFIGLLRV